MSNLETAAEDEEVRDGHDAPSESFLKDTQMN